MGDATIALQDALEPLFADKNYGPIDQLMVVAVAVGSPIDNERYIKAYNKIGILKNPFNGEKVKYISVAISFDPSVVASTGAIQTNEAICLALLGNLESPCFKIPKAFEYNRFVSDMTLAIATLRSKVN